MCLASFVLFISGECHSGFPSRQLIQSQTISAKKKEKNCPNVFTSKFNDEFNQPSMLLRFLFRLKQEPSGTSREQLVYAKKLYESAFHPDSGDLQNVFGRMSFQVPGGMAITGAMLQFYKYENKL